MSDELIDLRKGEAWGERRRTLQVSRCRVCNALSNRVREGARYQPAGFICPHQGADWHRLAQDKLFHIGHAPHPKSYVEELRSEVRQLVADNRVQDDLVGNPDLEQEGHIGYQGRFIPTEKA